MADEEHEDSWLYGNSNPEPPNDDNTTAAPSSTTDAPDSTNKTSKDTTEKNKNGIAMDENPADEMEEQDNENDKTADDAQNDDADENGDDSDDSDDDDDINVVIGDIKSGPSYNIKQRPPLLGPPGAVLPADKTKQAPGKFSIDEFECVGTISGVPAPEFSIDSLDDKPWRKPGADITDYFNYGFNEDTWRAYCERQKHMRLNESGVGLAGLSAGLAPLTSIANDTGTYVGGGGSGVCIGGGGGMGGRGGMGPGDGGNMNMGAGGLIRRAGPPPGRKVTGQIDVIGSNGLLSRREVDGTLKPVNPAKENVIQVMTAERREYSRPTGKFDGPMGPPPPFGPNDGFFDQPDDYNYGYEPTQEHQWINDNPNWMPSGIKELTPGPQMIQPVQMVPPPNMGGGMMRPPMGAPQQMGVPPHMGGSRVGPPMHNNMPDRDRERERERDRDRDRDRERERSSTTMDRDRERIDQRDRERDRDRDRERDYRDRDRGKSEESERGATRERDRYRERSSRKEVGRERSRSRERRRRSKSRDKERKKDKKKSHKKDKDDSE